MRSTRPIAQAALLAACAILLLAATLTQAAFMSPTGNNINSSSPVCYSHWQSVGPFAVRESNGLEQLTGPEGIGAAQEVWVHNNTAFLASVNGGVWRAKNFHTYDSLGGPHWEAVTDDMLCSSISAISGSADDPLVVVAGCGFRSTSVQGGGEPLGVMITFNGGDSWSMTDFPEGYDVSSVLVSGVGSSAIVLVSAREAIKPVNASGHETNPYNVQFAGGIWYSDDAGLTFTNVFPDPVNQLKQLAASSPVFAVTLNDGAPVIVSHDNGIAWSPTLGTPPVTAQCTGSILRRSQVTLSPLGGMAVGFYLADAIYYGGCYAVFYSNDEGANWSPVNSVSSNHIGLKGLNHFTLLLSPNDTDTLFVAGAENDVYRVVMSMSKRTKIAASDDSSPFEITMNNTVPHADARQLAWDPVTGELLLTNDGGLYRRTNPLDAPTLGNWYSLAGDLAITEVYQAAVDPWTGAMMLATQGNALMISQWDGSEANSARWSYLFAGNSSSVGLDTSVSPARFISSTQGLTNLVEVEVLDGVGVSPSDGFTNFTGGLPQPADCKDGLCFGSHTKIAINAVTPSKSLVCTQEDAGRANSVCFIVEFPSTVTPLLEFNSSDATLNIPPTDALTDYVFGGRRDGVANEDVVFAVGDTFLWARQVPGANVTAYTGSSCTAPCNMSSAVKTDVPWTSVAALAQHPQDYHVNLVIDDAGHCWLTTNFGQNWTDLNDPANSNLFALSGHTSVDTLNTGAAIFVDTLIGGVQPLIIGTPYGSFVTFNASNSSYFTFVDLGANQPTTIPTSYSYQNASDTLTMSTLGRGVWQLQSASLVLAQAARGEATTAVHSNCTVPLYPNVPGVFGYTTGPTPEPIGFPGSYVAPSSSSSSSSSTGAPGSDDTSSTGYGSSSTGTADNPTSDENHSSSSSTGADGSSPGAGINCRNVTDVNGNVTVECYSSSTGAASSTASTGSGWDSSSSGGDSSTASIGSSTGADGSSTGANSSSPTGADWSSTGTATVVHCYNATINGTESVVCDEVSPTGASNETMSTGSASGTTADASSSAADWSGSSSTGAADGSASSSSAAAGSASSSSGAAGGAGSSTGAAPGPASSSTGSSSFGSSTGGDGGGGGGSSGSASNSTSSSSSTGAVGPVVVIVPESLPVFELTLDITLSQIWLYYRKTLVQFGQAVTVDLAQMCKLPVSRVLLLKLDRHPLSNDTVLVRFTFSDRLAESQLRSQAAGQIFLAAGRNDSFVWPSSLHDIVPGSAVLAADQTVVKQLPLTSFTLAYNLGALPGGSLVKFCERLVADIARFCEVATSRIAIQRVLAGSVQATFLVSPPVDAAVEPAATVITSRFIEGLNNQTSALYTDSDVAAASVAGSGKVGSPDAPPPAPVPASSSSSKSGFMDEPGEIGLVVGLVIGGLLIGAAVIWVVYNTVLKAKPAPKVQDRKPAVQLSSVAVQDPPRAQPVVRAALPAAAKPPSAVPTFNKAASLPVGSSDVRLTLASGYGPVRPLLSPSAGGGPGARPVPQEDTAHFTLSDDVGAQPYFAGAPTVVAGSPSGPAPYGARPASPGMGQSSTSPQSGGNGNGSAHPPLSRARSPNSFRIMYSSKKKALPSMLPASSPTADQTGAPAGSPMSPSVAYSPASSSAAVNANSDAAMRLKLRQSATNVSGTYGAPSSNNANGRSSYSNDWPSQ